jgi:hypothetical protein
LRYALGVSGPHRLAVFFSVAWVAVWLFLSSLDPEFKWEFFVVVGIVPVALIWGIRWVVAGFRSKQ